MKQQSSVEWLYDKLLNAEPNILEWEKYLVQAKAMHKREVQHYAKFAINCDRKSIPILDFDGWINL